MLRGDKMLKFVVATLAGFDRVNIDVSNERLSIDGTKSLKHMELLTADQFNLMRFDALFQFVGDAEIYDLMETAEWKTVDSQ